MPDERILAHRTVSCAICGKVIEPPDGTTLDRLPAHQSCAMRKFVLDTADIMGRIHSGQKPEVSL